MKHKMKMPKRDYDDGVKPVVSKELREKSERKEMQQMEKSMKMRACR